MNTTHPEDMRKSREWAGRFITGSDALPVSFVLEERTIAGLPEDWQPVSSRRRIDATISETVFEGNDPRTGLNVRVECTEYHDYPVVEWVTWLTNKGDETTPVIRDILVLDGTFKGSSPVLYHCNGDFYSEEGYTPQETPLQAGDTLGFAPNGGRSCDGAFPYYRVMFEDCGLCMAIGWPGQWAANFKGLADGVHVRVGQQKTHLRLMPGERIRTPRMTVLSWTGDVSRAANLWRRWYLAHVLPRPNGQPLKPLLACCCPDDGEEFTAATEENQLRYIEQFKQRGIRPDVWWIDAGWYPCYNKDHQRKWWITGTWEPDPERFPNGLKPVSDRADRDGADLLVWFEPERVQPGTTLDAERPEWLLRTKDSDNSLLNLGNPECRQWLTDHVCRLIEDNGIKVYRQDHNFSPLEHWRKNEAQDRQGLNENLHVQGYLQFWDDLLARNPGLWIDSCASGGRRNDLETMRRSVPLHYTDYGYGNHPVKLAFHHTLSAWIPYFKEVTLSWDISGAERFDNRVDSYSYHCGMAPMLFATLDIRRDDYDYALAKSMIGIWRRASALMLYGDYYPLTPFHRSAERWVVRQFDCPETGHGLFQGIRFPASPEETATIHPKGIDPGAMYVLENPETGETRDMPGAVLSHDGFTFALPKRSGAIWFYSRVT
ncbi:MAG: alpha-galactosidase [Candidatus Latescibacteria bacterium]|nr:alpha-galactosidase [Candidatus Latescibacterota bacterium]